MSKGGGKESNIQLVPFLVQMTIFLAQCATQTHVRERVEGHVHSALQALGGIDTSLSANASGGATAARSPTGSGDGASGSGSRSSGVFGRASFSSMPFLNADFAAFGSGSAAAAAASSRPSSSPSLAAGQAGSSASAPGPVASLQQLLSGPSLAGLAPSLSLGGDRIRGSLYADPTDYLEYIMVLSLSFFSRSQWEACRFSMLWRLIAQAKESLALEIAPEEGETGHAAGGANKEAKADASPADHDMGVAADAKAGSAAVSAPAAAAAAATAPSPPSASVSEAKECEHKSGDASASSSSSSPQLTDSQRSLVSQTQLDVLRPILLFWSLIDALHAALSPPAGAAYSAAHSDSFLSSTGSLWFRRWRRCFTRAAAFATFRSIQRREEEILSALTGPLLQAYERNVAAGAKSLAELFDAVGATDQLAREGVTLHQLLDKITQVTIAPPQ